MGYLPHRDVDLFINSQELSQISSINWEAALQRRIEEELYDSALKVLVLSFLGLSVSCLCLFRNN